MVTTGIPEFDRLLGLDKTTLEGAVMLIRGKPGSGKTTLALQILYNILNDINGRVSDGMLVSLEVLPGLALNRFDQTFLKIPKFDVFTADQVKVIPPVRIATPNSKPKQAPEKGNIDIDLHPSILVTVSAPNLNDHIKHSLAELKNKLHNHVAQGQSVDVHEPRFRDAFNQALADSFSSLFDLINRKTGDDSRGQPLVIVIDSLTAFANQLISHCPDKESSREAMSAFMSALHSVTNRPAFLILLAEFDFAKDQSVLSESYLCDIEVVLSSEPLTGEPRRPLSLISSSGYDYSISRNVESPNGIDVAEVRSFCRILKSRWSDHQSRRCLYEIRADKGIVFHEHFPGDGEIRLFEENAPQRKVWREFLETEVPKVYPSLRAHRFDAITLQRTFGTLRHLLHHPERTDLMLATFDSYWLDELRMRSERLALEQFLRDATSFEPGKDKHADKLVGSLHSIIRSKIKANPTIQSKKLGPQLENVKAWKAFVKSKLDDDGYKRLESLIAKFSSQGLFMPLDLSQLRLYGTSKKSVKFVGDKGEHSQLFSIPYNNNVSFIVCRKDILIKIRDKLRALDDDGKTFFQGIRESAEALGISGKGKPLPEAVLKVLWKHFLDEAEPKTWEEVHFLCKVGPLLIAAKDSHKQISSNSPITQRPFQLAIETGVFDTLAATFLELIWSCGGWPMIDVDYVVKKGSKRSLELDEAISIAAEMLSCFVRDDVIPDNSTINPVIFSDSYQKKDDSSSNPPRRDWLFARHWHSTFVNLMTLSEPGKPAQFVWKAEDGKDIDLMPMPLTTRWIVDNLYSEDGSLDEKSIYNAKGFSTKGDWHLAVLGTSENKTLAHDLVNNLMSLPKVNERSFSCAALPTIEEFYKDYEKLPALNIRKRTGENILPKKDFLWFKQLFVDGRARSDIYDFRTCMNCIAPVIETALRIKLTTPETSTERRKKAKASVKRISQLKESRPALY